MHLWIHINASRIDHITVNMLILLANIVFRCNSIAGRIDAKQTLGVRLMSAGIKQKSVCIATHLLAGG